MGHQQVCRPSQLRLKVIVWVLAGGTLIGAIAGCAHSPPEGAHTEAASAPDQSLDRELRFEPEAENRAGANKIPYVVLVSIDGYRYDFTALYHPKNLAEIAVKGVAADSLLPVYPSKTFPSHYSIATGLHSDHHGIVSNEFYDPKRGQTYALGDRSKVEDGSWYLGEPIWLTANRQGLLSAACFWVGSEANILGRHPNYYYRYNKSTSSDERVERVLNWLKLPAARRPHLITLYFDIVDLAAHRNGVDQTTVPEAVHVIDDAIGKLREGIRNSQLPVDLIVVSDHGMEDLDASKMIAVDEIFGVTPLLKKFIVVGRGPQMMLYLKPGEDPAEIDEMLRRLRLVKNHFRAEKRSELKSLHYSASDRIGDIVIIPEIPYLVGFKTDPPVLKGANHGWDVTEKNPEAKNMRGILYAEGPNFKAHSHLPSIENTNVYPMIAHILKLKVDSKIDGKLSVTRKVLKP